MKKAPLVYTLALIGTVAIVSAGTTLAHGGLGFGFGHGLFMGSQPDRAEVLEQHASLLGMSAEELQAQLDSGVRFAEIAEQRGIGKSELRAVHEEQMDAHLDDLVAAGDLTQQQADEMRALRDQLDSLRQEHRQAVADLLSITVDELDELQRPRDPLANRAEELGVTEELEALRKEHMIETITAEIDAAVASGRLTQDEATEKLADAIERIESGGYLPLGMMKLHRGQNGHHRSFMHTLPE